MRMGAVGRGPFVVWDRQGTRDHIPPSPRYETGITQYFYTTTKTTINNCFPRMAT